MESDKAMTQETDHRQVVLWEVLESLQAGTDVSLEGIENRLGALYVQHQAANDAAALTLIHEAWERIQTLAQVANGAIDKAAAAREVAAMMKQQRDTTIRVLVDTQRAANELDRHNPIVDTVAAHMEEAFTEEMEYGEGYARVRSAAAMIEEAEIPISYEQADTFLHIITDVGLTEIDPTLAQDMRRRIGVFVAGLVKEFDAAADVWGSLYPADQFTGAVNMVLEGDDDGR